MPRVENRRVTRAQIPFLLGLRQNRSVPGAAVQMALQQGSTRADLPPADYTRHIDTLLNIVKISSPEEARSLLTAFFADEGRETDFGAFSEAFRRYARRYDGKKVVLNKGILFKLSNPDVSVQERVENAYMFAHPAEVREAYLEPATDDYAVIDVAPKVRQCFLGKIKPKDEVLIISFGDGTLEAEIAKKTEGRVIIVNPIADQAKKMKEKGLTVIRGNPNELEAVLAKAGITGAFDKVILSEAIGELDIPGFFAQAKKYVKEGQALRNKEIYGAGKLLITTYLPAKNPDLCGYERMSIAALSRWAESRGFLLDERSVRIFEVLEERNDPIIVSEVSDPTLQDGFVYLEFNPASAAARDGFSTEAEKNINFIWETYVYMPHGSMGAAFLPDGRMLCPTQGQDVYIADQQGKIVAVFDYYRMYAPEVAPKRDYLNSRSGEWHLEKGEDQRNYVTAEINAKGSEGAHFSDGVEVDKEGDIYFGAEYSERIDVYDQNFHYLRSFNTGKRGFLSYNPADDNLYILGNKVKDDTDKVSKVFVFSKEGRERETIESMDGIDLTHTHSLAFGPGGRYYFALADGIYIFSAERKLEKKIPFPDRKSKANTLQVNARGEIFIGFNSYLSTRDNNIVVLRENGDVAANFRVNNGGNCDAGFGVSALRAIRLIDDDTFVVCDQYESKVKAYRLMKEGYTDLVRERMPGLREKTERLLASSLGYVQYEELIMGGLYRMLLRGDGIEQLTQVIDLLIRHKEEILSAAPENIELLFEVFNKVRAKGYLFLKLINEINPAEGEFRLFLKLIAGYFLTDADGNGENKIEDFPRLWTLALRMRESDLPFKDELVQIVLLRGGGDTIGVGYNLQETVYCFETLLEIPFNRYKAKKKDCKALFCNFDGKGKHPERNAEFFQAMERYCGEGRIPFKVFCRLYNVAGADAEILDIYQELFARRKGTFAEAADFEQQLSLCLKSFHRIEPGKRTSRAKRSAFILVSRNLLWQSRQTQICILSSFSSVSDLFTYFDRYGKYMTREVIEPLLALDEKTPLLQAELMPVIGRIGKIFAYRVMGIRISKLSAAEQARYHARDSYYDTFVPLALNYAGKHPDYLPVVKLIFLSLLKGDFQRLRTDREYYPDWVETEFSKKERESVEKYLFKRGLGALRQVLGKDDPELERLWAFDEEEMVRVNQRDFADLISALAQGAHKAGFAYASREFNETRRTTAALRPERLLDEMNRLRSVAQDLRYSRCLVEEGRTFEEIVAAVKFLSPEFLTVLFREGDRDQAAAALETEYGKVVFRQNLISAARLANEQMDKEIGVEAKLNSFLARIKGLTGELAQCEQFLADLDLAHPGQASVQLFKQEVLQMMQRIEERLPDSLNEEKLKVMRVLARMMDFAVEFEQYLSVLVSKSNSLAVKMTRVGEKHAVEGYIDSVGAIVMNREAHVTSYRVKDTSDPVEIMVGLKGQCLDYTGGSSSDGLTDILLNPSVKVNMVMGQNGERRTLANQMVILGQALDKEGGVEPAVILDQTYGTWGTSRAYLLTKVKKSFLKARKMGLPLIIPEELLEKVGFLPAAGKETHPDAAKAERKEALTAFKKELEEDLNIHTFRKRSLRFRFFSGGAPRLYTDLGGGSWWNKLDGDVPFAETEPKEVLYLT